MFTKRRRNGGFTLVEAIITITIIVVLISTLVFSLVGYIRKARRATLIARCHDCVLAAQALVLENYANNRITVSNGHFDTRVTGTDVAARAQVSPDEGSVDGLEFDGNLTLVRLTYKASNSELVTYKRDTSASPDSPPEYIFSTVEVWSIGKMYAVGDIMETGGYRFRCIRAHESGTGSSSRNPTEGSNKGSWEVVGYSGDVLHYFYMLRYAEGVSVVYQGNLYVRTGYMLSSGQTPLENKSSSYWTLVGPAP